jgi:hypothetical protein
MSQDTAAVPDCLIPLRLVIGVTGHRTLEDEKALSTAVEGILARIKPPSGLATRTPVIFTVLSPLAEGADRLVAREVLKVPGSQLEVVLPMDEDEYKKDFPKSVPEFERLLRIAARVKTLTAPEGRRDEAYSAVGRYVVNHCDLLIALWNGERAAGRGGTAEIIEYAREIGCPLYRVNTQDPTSPAVYEGASSENVQVPTGLEEYNREPRAQEEIISGVREEYGTLIGKATKAGVDTGPLNTIYGKVLPHYACADSLARGYQRKYYLAGILIYTLAAAAVAVAASQLFAGVWKGIPLVEVVLMAMILIILRRGHRSRWHVKYIQYRSLAERIRSGLFMSLGTFDVGGQGAPRRRSHSSPADWITDAVFSIWSESPPLRLPDQKELAAVKQFLGEAWLLDQIGYYEKSCDKNNRQHSVLLKAGAMLFVLSLIAAALHFVGNYGEAVIRALREMTGREPALATPVLHSLHGVDKWLMLTAIVAPAVGSALGAIRTHREHLRIARRHEQTARQLRDLKLRFNKAENFTQLLTLMSEAEATVLSENEDWRVAIEVREIELPS